VEEGVGTEGRWRGISAAHFPVGYMPCDVTEGAELCREAVTEKRPSLARERNTDVATGARSGFSETRMEGLMLWFSGHRSPSTTSGVNHSV